MYHFLTFTDYNTTEISGLDVVDLAARSPVCGKDLIARYLPWRRFGAQQTHRRSRQGLIARM
jgi:hypothetical protein